MAPLPVNSTPRIWLRYNNGHNEHEMMIRVADGTNLAAMIAVANDLGASLATFCAPTGGFLGARYSNTGSIVSNPLAVTPVGGSAGTTADDDKQRCVYFSIVGRDELDRRVKYSVYAFSLYAATVFRQSIASSTPISDFVETLSGNDVVTIAGNPVEYNAYFNIGFNSYWQKQVR